YYDNGGNGSGGNVGNGLGNRIVLYSPKPDYSICNSKYATGKIVVQIEVDKNGQVTKATAGIKGATGVDECLLRQAEKAALLRKYNKDLNAPLKQTGNILYVFDFSKGN
ncbi:MAG: energy transducer TonB, partial [Lutibacter sp.]